MPLRAFSTVPQTVREWVNWCNAQFIVAEQVADQTVTTATIVDDAVTDAKLRHSAALSVIGRSVNSAGNPADIAAANDGEVLRRNGASLGFGVIGTSGLADGAVTNAKSADMADSTIKGRASGAGSGDPTDLTGAQVATIVSAAVASTLNVTSGTYTPTLTNVANITASTAYQSQYIRIGNVVTVSGKVDVDPTAAISTQLGISLPIPSSFGAQENCAGSASASAVAGQCAAILADSANDRAQMEWVAIDLVARAMYYSFTYQVI